MFLNIYLIVILVINFKLKTRLSNVHLVSVYQPALVVSTFVFVAIMQVCFVKLFSNLNLELIAFTFVIESDSSIVLDMTNARLHNSFCQQPTRPTTTPPSAFASPSLSARPTIT